MRHHLPRPLRSLPVVLRTHVATALAALLALGALAPVANAQEASDTAARRKMFESIKWEDAGTTGRLGEVGTLKVPAGCQFTEAEGAKTFMLVSENTPSGQEVGALYCGTQAEGNPEDVRHWFVTYEFDPSGYVKDDEKSSLDATKMLATMQEQQSEANKERKRRGWDELNLDGWIRAPYYDEKTNNLTWAMRVVSPSDTSVNHSVRLLGRRGVLKVDLVSGPATFERALPVFNDLVASTTFAPGQKYSEWRDGDKVAEYGLTALVAGGAGAAAMKLGLFGKLWKVIASMFVAAWKAVAVAIAAISAKLKSWFGKKKGEESPAPSA